MLSGGALSGRSGSIDSAAASSLDSEPGGKVEFAPVRSEASLARAAESLMDGYLRQAHAGLINTAGVHEQGVRWTDPLVFTPYVAPDRESAALLVAHADGGDPVACVTLGLMYEFGTSGVEQSDEKAVRMFQRAADLEDPEGLCCLASMLESGRGAPKDAGLANALFQRAADLGHPRAYCCMGVCYDNGDGVEKNPKLAAKWYGRARDRGLGKAMFFLAHNVERASGFCERYLDLLTEAALQNRAQALLRLGGHYENGFSFSFGTTHPPMPERALACYRQAASIGAPAGRLAFALCYLKGVGVPANAGVAVEMLVRLTGSNDAKVAGEACVHLGAHLLSSEGPDRDVSKAVSFFTKAVAKGDPAGSRWLGQCYEKGIFFERDLEKAKQGYRASAGKQDAQAQCMLAALLMEESKGTWERERGKEIMEMLGRACNANSARAFFMLGQVWETGNEPTVTKSMSEALRRYQQAAALGWQAAHHRLAQHYLSPATRNLASAATHIAAITHEPTRASLRALHAASSQ